MSRNNANYRQRLAAQVLGDSVFSKFPFMRGTRAVSHDPAELVLNRTWRPALSIIGIGGVPTVEQAGNVLRAKTEARLSLRLPPTCNAEQASLSLKTLFERDAPYGAKVTFTPDWAATPAGSLRHWRHG